MKKVLSVFAAGLLLAACESTDKSAQTGGFDNWPKPSAEQDGAVPGSAADFQKNVGDTVHFGFDKSNITTESKNILGKQADWLKKWPQAHVVIEGHCDIRGTTEYNMGLGERRSNAVKNELVAHGVDANRIEVVSYGKEHPVDPGTTEEAHAKNRRGVTVVR